MAKILVVDDSPTRLTDLVEMVENQGHEAVTASNGMEGIEQARAQKPDLILMDVMMPGMDGLEATRRIRADPRFRNLPIIAITAKAMKDDQARCLSAGASDYLAKPVDLDRLYSLLRVWLPSMERL